MRAVFEPNQSRNDQIRAMLNDKLTYGQIAAQLNITRNIVAGVAWRKARRT
jgi:hypothetical protein